MEDHVLQKLHDGISRANNRRGRQGGLGGVAGQEASKGTHTFFGEDGTAEKSSGLYAHFVKGLTLTASREMTCSVLKSESNDEDKQSGHEPTPASPKLEPRKKSKSARVEVAASDPTDTAEAEPEQTRSKRRKMNGKTETTGSEQADAEPDTRVPTSSFAEALCSGGLVRVVLQGGRQTLRDHLLSAIPQCRRFILLGGCGTVDTLFQRSEEGDFSKYKKLWAAHLNGTCDLQDAENFPSASGIFHISKPGLKRPYVMHWTFGIDDFFAGSRGVCEIWGIAFDETGKCVAI